MQISESERYRSFPDEGKSRRWAKRSLLAAAGLALFPGCTPEIYHTRADREAYSAIFQKTPQVENVDAENVDIAVPGPIDLSNLSGNGASSEFLGKVARYERDAQVLQLADALEKDRSIKVVVFQSANPEIFVCHYDVELLKDMSDKAVSREKVELLGLQSTLERISKLPQATICKIEGFARGGGHEFCLA